MSSPVEELPTLLPIIYGNEVVDVIKLSIIINLSALSEMACLLTVSNIQQHKAEGAWLAQTAFVKFQYYPIMMINGRNLVC